MVTVRFEASPACISVPFRIYRSKSRFSWRGRTEFPAKNLGGTHQGDFKGFPATGRPIGWRERVTSRFRDGLIAKDG